MNNRDNLQFIIAISKGIARDRRIRRLVLFFIVLAALLMVFAGTVIFGSWLTIDRPVLFLLYWGVCIWFTFVSLLMALYDLLMVRQEARRERQRLKAEVFGMNDRENP